jgi:putative nucleotidyltransferase with HDIG domain
MEVADAQAKLAEAMAQLQALEQLGQAGSEAGVAFIRALTAMVLIVVVVGFYLFRSQPEVWRDPGRCFVLAAMVVLSSLGLAGVGALADAFESSAWWFAFPAGGVVLLLSVLISPQVGTMSVLPLAGVALLMAPALPALAIFIAAVAVLAAPLAGGVSTRVALRRAGVRVAIAAPLVAGAVAVVFGPRDQIELVLLASALGGIAGAAILQSLLPTFENIFRLATVTALLDLADRNHPLLRELEQKAIGSYNHSVMVASLTERCCREIRANHLLVQVAALYHDIGKVRQPHFFIENQRGIANPHDDLEPRVSAVIIQNHVKDGVEMAEKHRLPPEVVSCIGSHHGTMVVTYFYRQAVAAAGGDEDAVDEGHFRYKGHRPRSKEAAVLLLADCCEATTRAMAMDRGTLPGDEIEQIVDRLLHERVDDGQFDDCELTFVELQTVRDTLVDALTGIYHPRIQYPDRGAGSEAA